MPRLCTWLFTGMLLACSLATLPAVAQTSPPPAPPSDVAPPAGAASGAHTFIQEVRSANTTHDGRLTLQQAQAAAPTVPHMALLVRRFAAIDVQHKGYVTLRDIRAYRQRLRAARNQPVTTNSN